MLVCWLCSLLWPPSKSQPTRYLCPALASPAECHITWPHINTHTDVETQKVRPAVHSLEIPTEDVSRGPREAGLDLEGTWRKSVPPCSACNYRLDGVLFLTPLKRGSTPEPLVLESIAKNRWQMLQHGWWILLGYHLYPGECRCEYTGGHRWKCPGGHSFPPVPSSLCLPSLLSLISATCRFRDSC